MLLPSVVFDAVTVTTTVTINYDLAPPSLVAPAPPPRRMPPPDRPVLLGVAAGAVYGVDTKDKCADLECVAGAIDLAVAIHGNVYAVASAVAADSPDHRGTSTHHAETLGLRLQHERAWAEAGIGVGSRRHYTDETTWMYAGELDLGASAAVGFDAVETDAYALGVQLRAATTTDVEHTMVACVLLGMTWH